jgi:hypothetical protein
MPSSPQTEKLPLLEPKPTPNLVESAVSLALAIPAKVVTTAVTNPVGTVKHAASFLFGPGLFLVGMLLAAVAWTAVKAAAIADTRFFKAAFGQTISEDAQWKARLTSVENSVEKMIGFCFYSFITGAKILNEEWANYSADHVGGNARDRVGGFNQENHDACLSEEEQKKAMQREVAQLMDAEFFEDAQTIPTGIPLSPNGIPLDANAERLLQERSRGRV